MRKAKEYLVLFNNNQVPLEKPDLEYALTTVSNLLERLKRIKYANMGVRGVLMEFEDMLLYNDEVITPLACMLNMTMNMVTDYTAKKNKGEESEAENA